MAIRKTTGKSSPKKAAAKVKSKSTVRQKSSARKQPKQGDLLSRVRERAYFIWLEKGWSDVDCWCAAEAEISGY